MSHLLEIMEDGGIKSLRHRDHIAFKEIIKIY